MNRDLHIVQSIRKRILYQNYNIPKSLRCGCQWYLINLPVFMTYLFVGLLTFLCDHLRRNTNESWSGFYKPHYPRPPIILKVDWLCLYANPRFYLSVIHYCCDVSKLTGGGSRVFSSFWNENKKQRTFSSIFFYLDIHIDIRLVLR